MRSATLLAIITAIALTLPMAQAQSPPTGMTFVLDDPVDYLPYDGAGNLNYTVTVGCLEILQNTGATTVNVASDAPPLGITIGGDTSVELDETACLTNNGFATATGTLTITPASDAPGRQPAPITVTATYGTLSAQDDTTVEVAYRPGYNPSIEEEMPITVNGDTHVFNLTLTVTSNTATMAMFELLDASNGGADTLGSITLPNFINFFEVDPANGTTQVIEITYRAPASSWTNDTVVFKTWSHWMQDGDLKTEDQIITWNFVSGTGHEHQDHEHDETNKNDDKFLGIPGPGPVLLLGLLSVALWVARRRA